MGNIHLDKRRKNCFVYVVECKTPGYFYVGMTTSLVHRMFAHIRGIGGMFTAKHGFKSLKKIIPVESISEGEIVECQTTKQMRTYPGAVMVGGPG